MELKLGTESAAAHLAGVSFKGEIYVFGGTSNSSYVMHKLSEEGHLVEDLITLILL